MARKITVGTKDVLTVVVVLSLATVLAYVGSLVIDTRPKPTVTYLPRKARVTLPSGPVNFLDVAQSSGVDFIHNNGAFGLAWIPETLGSGAVFLDYDADGFQDLFFVNGRDWRDDEIIPYTNGPGQEHFVKRGNVIPRRKPRKRTTGALYRNNGDGSFANVTEGSGLDVEIYGVGAAAGDYDNDGRTDLLVTSLAGNYLFQNVYRSGSKRKFVEVSQKMGVRSERWFSSAAFLDFNKDGKLDLFASRYVQWSFSKEVPAMYFTTGTPPVEKKTYSGPNSYGQDSSALFLNTGEMFSDVARKAGIETAKAMVQSSSPNRKRTEQKPARSLVSNGLGVAICDFNRDSWPDIFVANDFKPNFLFRNDRNGTFSEVAVQSGVAFSNNGATRAGMGVDTMDVEGNGDESLIVGNYVHQHMGYYKCVGRTGKSALYRDFATELGLDKPTDLVVTFGCVFADVDNDSLPDIFMVNGHVRDDVDINPHYDDYGRSTYAQRPIFLWNRGKGRPFQDAGFNFGKPQPEVVGRGLAYADYDLDGDLDMVITSVGGRPVLMRNEGGNKNNSIRITLEGTRSNRSAIGAVVVLKAGKKVFRRTVKSGSSYLCQSELPLTIGIGREKMATKLSVHWPSGEATQLGAVKAKTHVVIREGHGLVRAHALVGTTQRAKPKL